MREIGTTFADDAYGQEFMVWREEQRAIGELVLDSTTGEGPRSLMGFASFVRRYEQDFAAWFAPLSADLHAENVERNARLAKLQSSLGDLVEELGTTAAPTAGRTSTVVPDEAPSPSS
jgi:hypothetical protein